MSSQRGNVSRTRKQKYQNSHAFKNDLHDTTQKVKMMNNLSHEGLCQRCKEKIEWKIKYKKYKPLTKPATCIRCKGKTVKRAYHTVCQPCATQADVCAKCNSKKEIVMKPGLSEEERRSQDSKLKFELEQLKERQRRTFFRHLEKGGASTVEGAGIDIGQEDDSDDRDDADDYDVDDVESDNGDDPIDNCSKHDEGD